MLMDTLEDPQEGDLREGDEQYLKELLDNEKKVKKTRELKEIDTRLDRLKRIRTEGK